MSGFPAEGRGEDRYQFIANAEDDDEYWFTFFCYRVRQTRAGAAGRACLCDETVEV